MSFLPEQVLFSVTTDCNLACPHCVTPKTPKVLPTSAAIKFLAACKPMGLQKIGFTGGEPFLVPNFLYKIIRYAVKNNLLFDKIITNAVWYNTREELESVLSRLSRAGYDGTISISVDGLHTQPVLKIAQFIKTVLRIWCRADVITITIVVGVRERETYQKLYNLSRLIRAKLYWLNRIPNYIKNGKLLIKINKINLSPIGKAAQLKYPWDGKWFKEDYCQGPGNVFFVLPDGKVKPCCGYATDLESLTIGNIHRHSPKDIMRNVYQNRFVYTVFQSGLSKIHDRLQCFHYKLPGKTSNHCYFCYYLLTEIPNEVISRCLD